MWVCNDIIAAAMRGGRKSIVGGSRGDGSSGVGDDGDVNENTPVHNDKTVVISGAKTSL